jgi:hypothetical protein
MVSGDIEISAWKAAAAEVEYIYLAILLAQEDLWCQVAGRAHARRALSMFNGCAESTANERQQT